MKWSRNRSLCATRSQFISIAGSAAILGVVCFGTLRARADLPVWMQSVISNSAIESALYCMMDLPGMRVLYPRLPAEARGELSTLLHAKPDEAELYALRARTEEAALDFSSAEQDWKAFTEHAQDKPSAEFELADFYHRRVQGPQEIAALEAAATAPATAKEAFLPADKQRAWQAFTRALVVAQDQSGDQALGDDATVAIYKVWIARYPAEPAARAAYIDALLKMRRFDAANAAIADYRTAFPQDDVFPIKASATVALRQGTADAAALAVYDKAYQPLWPADLVQSYFQVLTATHTPRAMLAQAHARLAQNPDDLSAVTRIFYYYQQAGRLDAAANALTQYRASKDERKAAWTADELFTFATLLDRTTLYEDAARYYFALWSVQGGLSASAQSPQEAALTGIIHILLTAPERPIDLGSGNLSIYRDVATIDSGPGYLNGILSLWLNSQNPTAEFQEEEQKATPYFHRAKAAGLLAILDQRFPNAASRPALHAALIRAYSSYGADAVLLKSGQSFLAEFPHASERMEVALAMADADARNNNTKAEFAVYDSLLAELAAASKGMPLSAAPPAQPSVGSGDAGSGDASASDEAPAATQAMPQQLSVPVIAPPTAPAATAYSQVLDRYLGRLTTSNQLPEALAVLRRELDRNPDDPLLYARFADFLQQNNFAAQQEEVYQRAIARFNDTVFYDKLARFYLRAKRRQEFDALTRKVMDIFHGTELEHYFANVNRQWPEVYLQLNLYAHQRFPHDLIFTRNLLHAYETKGTKDPAAWEQLLREHWSESSDLQAQFFDYLSRTHKLDGELAELKKLVPLSPAQQSNPAAVRELAELHLWQSHFEESAPLLDALAQAYPADASIGDEASSVFRSLAYYDPAQIAKAVEIEKHLSTAEPADLDKLARIGDTYADSTSARLNLSEDDQLAQAAPYWKRMSSVHPGQPDGYLQSATVFWDYFQFDQAIAQIEAARSRFHAPALYGYEAGAIYENKRDNAHAVAEYVRAAVTDSTGDGSSEPSSSAHARLLVLATRPEFADLVDKATAAIAEQSPTLTALNLRVDVLNARQQKSDVTALVEAAAAKAGNVDDAAQIVDFSQRNHLVSAYRVALQREIALAADPVQRIELQYQLAGSYENNGDLASAQRIIETVYNGNTKILGVVRATTDFYWKQNQPQHAIATLLEAAKEANASLSRDFMLEAVAKSNASGDFTGARSLLKPLLVANPFDEKCLALEADSYALAHEETGLRDFYANTLTSLKAAHLNATEQRDKIALVRQGMIAALTQLKDYSGAVDQHIALISAFPEDADVLQRAALYARRYGREQQLTGFLNKAVADSPRDARFAVALGRVDALFEDDDGALAAYSKAIAIRKDRPDIYMARADIEERQQAFDAACADYERLYVLTYKDPQWMEKAALARVRQGRADLAVKALQSAWIDGHPPAATNYFRVASRLEQWGLLSDARGFADHGVQLAGEELLTNAQDAAGAAVYARILGRQRHAGEALALLTRLRGAANVSPSSPAIVTQQVQERGVAAVTDEQWRVQRAKQQQEQAQKAFSAALHALSATVAEFYTPEEKLAYARLLDEQRANKPDQEVADVWIPAAQAADLKDREAAWRHDILLSGGEQAAAQLSPFDTLEAQRMDNAFRAETLEAFAAKLKPEEQAQPLSMAAQAWRDAGNSAAEARVLRALVVTHQQAEHQDRLFEVMLKRDPQALLKLASAQGSYAEAAANYAVAHGSREIAYQAVASHGATQSPLWAQANTALVGLYFNDNSPQIDTAFHNALADTSIGERLQSKVTEGKQLAGSPWFYYGMRYGVLLTLSPKPAIDPETYLPAGLEATPRTASAYVTLAQAYLDAKKSDAALAEYRHAEELAPGDPLLNSAMAEVLWSQGRRDDAIAEWRQAFAKLRALVEVRAVPESFWTGFASAAGDLHEHKLGAQFRSEMDSILREYIKKNGSYRAVELLHAAYNTLQDEDASAAADWILQLAGNAADESSILTDLASGQWFPRAQLGRVYRRELELAQVAYFNAPQPTAGEENFNLSTLTSVRAHYLSWLLRSGQVADAQHVFDGIPSTQRQDPSLQKIVVLLAVRQSRLPELLTSIGNDSANGPSLQILSEVANQLRRDGDKQGSRTLLEYVFQQKLTTHTLEASDYLALAEARLTANDTSGAMDLLHRLTMQPGDLYLNLDSAADLLVRSGHVADAIPLLTRLANSTPWNFNYRLRLGQAQLAAKQDSAAAGSFTAVATGNNAPYELRAQAAEALRSIPGTRSFNSAELVLLASAPNAQRANQPYFVHSRMAAAVTVPVEQRAGILRAAIGFAPDSLLDRLRLQLFHAEMDAGHYEMVAVAAHSLLSQTSSSADDSGSPYQDSGEEVVPDSETALPLPAVLTTPREKLDFLLALSTMYEHMGQDAEAVSALSAAAKSGADSAQRSDITKRIAAANDRILLIAENEKRRPVIHTPLDQSVVVRPRLTGKVEINKVEPGETVEAQP